MTAQAWKAIVLLLLLAGCTSVDSRRIVRIVWEQVYGDDVIVPNIEWAPALTPDDRWRYDGEFRIHPAAVWDVTDGRYEI